MLNSFSFNKFYVLISDEGANNCDSGFFFEQDAAAFWNQQPLAAREYASSTIVPACNIVADISNSAKDLIDQEVTAFYRCPDNSLYMFPSTPQV